MELNLGPSSRTVVAPARGSKSPSCSEIDFPTRVKCLDCQHPFRYSQAPTNDSASYEVGLETCGGQVPGEW